MVKNYHIINHAEKQEIAIGTESSLRINDEITADLVRLVDAEGGQMGIISITEAISIASNSDYDLVEIAPKADPPVCRLMDYGKFLYHASKNKSSQKKRKKSEIIKEITFRPGTDIGDYTIKVKKLRSFLEKGHRVKVTLRFRGREMMHEELGLEMLNNVRDDLSDISEVFNEPKRNGRQMVMLLSSLKK